MTASTMAFATLTLARLFHGFTCRSNFSVRKIKLMGNKWSIASFLTGTVLLSVVLFTSCMQKLFRVESLDIIQVGWTVLFSFLPTAGIQLVRMGKELLKAK